MGKSQQRKGRCAELELVQLLREHGIPAEPGQPVSFGSTPDVVGVPGIHCEVKRVEKLNVQLAMDQAVEDAQKFQDGKPVVFHRRSRKPWLVTMLLDDWVRLYHSESAEIGTDKSKEFHAPF